MTRVDRTLLIIVGLGLWALALKPTDGANAAKPVTPDDQFIAEVVAEIEERCVVVGQVNDGEIEDGQLDCSGGK